MPRWELRVWELRELCCVHIGQYHHTGSAAGTLAFGLNYPIRLIQLRGDCLSHIVYRHHEVFLATRFVLPVAKARAVLA